MGPRGQTLGCEIEEYEPTLVVFLTVNYWEEVVHQLVGEDMKPEWKEKFVGKPAESWTLQREGLPSMLWIRHPQGKRKEVIEEWLKTAKSVTNPDQNPAAASQSTYLP
jgi:hypothetical protein